MTADVRFETPASAKEAALLLAAADGHGRVLAGGTDLLVQMRSGRIAPKLIVDVKGIDEMVSIRQESGGWRVGASVACMELVRHREFAALFPAVVDGANWIGSIQVRSRASMGGNLCNASPAADSVPAMMAVGAVASIEGPNGRREIPVEQVPTGPGKNSLEPGEILVSIFFPNPPEHTGSAYIRFTPRTEMDIAVVGAGISLTLDQQGVCTAAKVCLGAVAEKAIVVPEAAQALIGTMVDDAALANLGLAASAAARPIDDKRGTKVFRTKLSGVIARRTAQKALARARGNI
ncbi:FAD binding domain-containing protein [Orrella daihaiensis]|uniref:Xanthine dehydrogenase family protein subunit M n=1 Tax=Orrella daihaiensis TaxID=2782176 RepID=A0ABY4AHE2_9BURK|nr:xanthine dehydrogenase family protein subunit M [Orrella daihaiensis]UOD49709.1 xanthine dehydrogenase family protein subunit M [Orrella daihaiensis]